VQIWDAATGERLLTYRGHERSVHGLTWAPDGTRIASAAWNGEARVWEVATGHDVLIYPSSDGPIAWSPDGKYLLSDQGNGEVIVWDASSGEVLSSYDQYGGAAPVAWSPDGKCIAFGKGLEKTVEVWDI